MLIAVTGGIGSGKSTVTQLLAERGAFVVDADQIAREVVALGSPTLAAIAHHFGAGVLNPDGTLARAELAAIVFRDAEQLAQLEAITHPAIAQRTKELIAEQPEDQVVVHDIPLFTPQLAAFNYTAVVVVVAQMATRIARLATHRGMAAEESQRRIAAQMSDAQRRDFADVVIDNDGSLAETAVQVDRFWDQWVPA